MTNDPLLLERLRLAAIVADALNSLASAQAALNALSPDAPERVQWQTLVLSSFDLASVASDRLLQLGAAPAVDSAGGH